MLPADPPIAPYAPPRSGSRPGRSCLTASVVELKPLPTAATADGPGQDAPHALYPTLLGPSWLEVAESIRHAHASGSAVRARGQLRIAYGPGRTARAVGWILRLPRASEAADTRLVVTSCAHGERWRRTFDGRRLDTRQYQVAESVLAERIGILEFRFRLDVSGGNLHYRQIEVAFLCGPIRLRLPPACAPRIDARETPSGAREVRVHVGVTLPALGSLLTYDGTMNFEDIRA